MNNDSEYTVKSPCIRHCTLNEDDVCVGCYRTLNDILNWNASTNEQKTHILSTALQRRKQLDV